MKSRNEFLRKSRTNAPVSEIEVYSLTILRNECQQCKIKYTKQDFEARKYQTCSNCKERSLCREHIESVEVLSSKC